MYRKTVDELQNDQREKLVIDIRSEEDYTKETYPGAKHIFWETFMDHIGEIPKDQPVYLFCYTGQRSDEIAEELSDKGYEIYSIEGGYRSYLRKKLADFMKEDDGTAERLADKAADAERSIIKKFKKTVWSTVRRHHFRFKRDAKLLEHIGSVFQSCPIRLGAHDDSN